MNTHQPAAVRIAAIVVTYHPEADILERLIAVLLADGVETIVVDNGGGLAALPTRWRNELTVLDLGSNRGLGEAINAGIVQAGKNGATHVITFDQDSQPSRGMVGVLAEEFERQVATGVKVGAVGPVFTDRRQTPPLVHPFARLGALGFGHRYCTGANETVEADMLITSGCLTSLEVLRDLGSMNADFFVDFTDFEWCSRAQSRGYALYGVCKAQMSHELGDGVVRRKFGVRLFEYSPARRYYFARNTIRMTALPYVKLRWKVRLLAQLIYRCLIIPWAPRAESKSAWAEGRMLLRGMWDGMRGVRGPLKLDVAP